MTFEEHLAYHRNDDGSYDLGAAEQARAKELAEDPTAIDSLARKAAKQERARWESQETTKLRKQFMQPALSPELELDTMVPLGESTAVRYGEMNHDRIRLRKDLRTRVHLDELRAFDAEISHWLQTESLLGADENIGDALRRATA
jgi:hypothetical protein